MDSPARLVLRHTLDAMRPTLVFELAVGALAMHLEHDFLEAANAVLAGADDLDLPAAPLGVARIHSKQIGREQRRLVATGALAHDLFVSPVCYHDVFELALLAGDLLQAHVVGSYLRLRHLLAQLLIARV